MKIKRKAHIFNLDNLLIDIDQKVWIIQKNNPNNCIMRISKDIFDSIKNGYFISKDLSMSFNDKTYYLDESTFEELKKKVKIKADDDELSFSFREFIDPKTIQDLEINYNYECVKHLKNTNDDIFFVATKGIDRKYGYIYNKLVDNLKEEFGLIVNQVYYLNQSFFGQNKDYNIKKLIYVILSNLVGKQIEDNKFTEDLDRDYTEVHFYDTNYVTINKIDVQLPDFMKKLGVENLRRKKVILDLVGSNKLKPFKSREIEFGMDYIKAFESFKKKDKTKLNQINESNKQWCDKLIKEFLKKYKIGYKQNIYYFSFKSGEYIIFIVPSEFRVDREPFVQVQKRDGDYDPRNIPNIVLTEKFKDTKELIKLISPYIDVSNWLKQMNENIQNPILKQNNLHKKADEIEKFLKKSIIPYKKWYGFKPSSLGENLEVIYFRIGDGKAEKRREIYIEISERTDSSNPRIDLSYYTNHDYPDHYEKFISDNKQIVEFISEVYPELISKRVINDINELKLNYKFQDWDYDQKKEAFNFNWFKKHSKLDIDFNKMKWSKKRKLIKNFLLDNSEEDVNPITIFAKLTSSDVEDIILYSKNDDAVILWAPIQDRYKMYISIIEPSVVGGYNYEIRNRYENKVEITSMKFLISYLLKNGVDLNIDSSWMKSLN